MAKFGPKTEIISDLTIQPTAAYLLAAPSVSDEAREIAIERAEAGEQITTVVANEILAETRKKKRSKRQKGLSSDKLGGRLIKVLERYRERWDPKDLAELARKLLASWMISVRRFYPRRALIEVLNAVWRRG